jgi:hypothetical protein
MPLMMLIAAKMLDGEEVTESISIASGLLGFVHNYSFLAMNRKNSKESLGLNDV